MNLMQLLSLKKKAQTTSSKRVFIALVRDIIKPDVIVFIVTGTFFKNLGSI